MRYKFKDVFKELSQATRNNILSVPAFSSQVDITNKSITILAKKPLRKDQVNAFKKYLSNKYSQNINSISVYQASLDNNKFEDWINDAKNKFTVNMQNGNAPFVDNKLLFKLKGQAKENNILALVDNVKPISAKEQMTAKNNIDLVSTKKLVNTNEDGHKQIEHLVYNRNLKEQILNIFDKTLNPETEIVIHPSKRLLKQIKQRYYKISNHKDSDSEEQENNIYDDIDRQLKENNEKSIINEQQEITSPYEQIRKIIINITKENLVNLSIRHKRQKISINLIVNKNNNYENKIKENNDIKNILDNAKININIKEKENNDQAIYSKPKKELSAHDASPAMEDQLGNTKQDKPASDDQSGNTGQDRSTNDDRSVTSTNGQQIKSGATSTTSNEARNEEDNSINSKIKSNNQGEQTTIKTKSIINFNSKENMIDGLKEILNDFIPNNFNIFKDRYSLTVQGQIQYLVSMKQLTGTLRLVTQRHVIPDEIIDNLKKLLYNKLNRSGLNIIINNRGRLSRNTDFNLTFSVPSNMETKLYPNERLIAGNNFILNEHTVIDDINSKYDVHDENLLKQENLQVFRLHFVQADDAPNDFISKKGTRCISYSFIAKDDKNQIIRIKYLTWEVHHHPERAPEIIAKLKLAKPGDLIAVSGIIGYDEYTKEVTITVLSGEKQGIKILEHHEIEDNSNNNGRYDLNVHTKMSALNSINNPNDIFDKATADGMGGVAITDDFTVQNFTSAVKAQNKYKDFKPIFGAELNTIPNKPTFVYNPNKVNFWNLNTEYVAFDIETTGFSDIRDDIIELSAVKYKLVPRKQDNKEHVSKKTANKITVDNDLPVLEITDSLHQLVKTNKELRQNIVDLTGITNEQLDLEGISIIDALNNFVNFIGDKNNTILIGQNVIFDIDFINEKLRKYNINNGQKLQHEIIDTLPIARHVMPNKRSYTLTSLTGYLDVKLTRAHHAISDAEATGFVGHHLLAYLSEINEYKVNNGLDLQEQENYDDFYKEQKFPSKVSALIKCDKGIKNLYRLISEGLTYNFSTTAKLYEHQLLDNREGLLLGSGGPGSIIWEYLSNKTYEKTKKYAQKMQFDYFEIAPLEAYANNEDLCLSGYKQNLHSLVKLAKELNTPLVVVSNSHYTNKEDYLAYKMLKRPLLRDGQKALQSPFMTTNELLTYFTNMLDGDNLLAKEIVVDNTVKIGKSISGDLNPIITKVNAPEMDHAEESLRNETWETAKKLYGDPLPDLIKDRLQTELDFIIKGGYTAHYLTAQKLVKYSNSLGYIVGSRGSVGSSAVAFMVGITEVNALPPHYRSKHGDYLEWADTNKYQDGFDLPKKKDPNHPGEWLIRDGHNLPFATFLGLHGTKVPDIDLNMASDIQSKVQIELKHIFGENHTIRVGTIQTVAQKTAIGYVANYGHENEMELTNAELTYYANKLAGTFKSTGQHPAGIMIVPKSKEILDFTPFQYPANKPGDWKITHFTKDDMHDALLKMDVLGHDDPSMLHRLEELTGIDPHTIDVTDPKIMELFEKQDTVGIPEFNTNFAQNVLKIAQPHTFNDLVQISGLSHGTNVWEGNAKELIENEGKTLADVIGSRDKIMQDLLAHGIDMTTADKVVKMVKKRIPFDQDMINLFKEHGIEDWYIESLKKIEYLYPAAHAIAYVMSALRIAYYKVYYPREFYATLFSYRLKQYDFETLKSNDIELVNKKLQKIEHIGQYDRTIKDKELLKLYTMLKSALQAGYVFEQPSLLTADSRMFNIDENNNNGIIIPLCAIEGLGSMAPQQIVSYRNTHNGQLPDNTKDFRSKADGCGVTSTVLKALQEYNIVSYGEIDEEKSTSHKKEFKLIYN